jgi:hypothetical protein
MHSDNSSEHSQDTATTAGELYTVRLPEEGVRQVIGALGVMSGISLQTKYEETMNAVQYQYEGADE